MNKINRRENSVNVLNMCKINQSKVTEANELDRERTALVTNF